MYGAHTQQGTGAVSCDHLYCSCECGTVSIPCRACMERIRNKAQLRSSSMIVTTSLPLLMRHRALSTGWWFIMQQHNYLPTGCNRPVLLRVASLNAHTLGLADQRTYTSSNPCVTHSWALCCCHIAGCRRRHRPGVPKGGARHVLSAVAHRHVTHPCHLPPPLPDHFTGCHRRRQPGIPETQDSVQCPHQRDGGLPQSGPAPAAAAAGSCTAAARRGTYGTWCCRKCGGCSGGCGGCGCGCWRSAWLD